MIGKKLFMIGGKAGFSIRKIAGKVMTADHHDRVSQALFIFQNH
jgi:hypothetical protein